MSSNAHYTSAVLTDELTRLRADTRTLVKAVEFLLDIIAQHRDLPINSIADSATVGNVHKAVAAFAKSAL